MIQTLEKEIDGCTYAVTQFPATEGQKILTVLMDLFGGTIGSLIEGAVSRDAKGKITKQSILDIDISSDAFGKAIKSLTSRLDEDRILNLVFRMLKNTAIKGKEKGRFGDGYGTSLFDEHFAGRLGTLYKLLFFVMEVNYADFFGVVGIGSPEKETASARN